MGAKPETFSGLSGLGDLVTTCMSAHSRNHFIGEEIAKGKTLKSIQKKMDMVAEGIKTAKSIQHLSKKYKVDMPISAEIYKVLYKNKSPKKAVNDLMLREKKMEL
jgi:glycerol-3-phosphate dehydrogenase (NAD(P)+)